MLKMKLVLLQSIRIGMLPVGGGTTPCIGTVTIDALSILTNRRLACIGPPLDDDTTATTRLFSQKAQDARRK